MSEVTYWRFSRYWHAHETKGQKVGYAERRIYCRSNLASNKILRLLYYVKWEGVERKQSWPISFAKCNGRQQQKDYSRAGPWPKDQLVMYIANRL